MREDDDAKNAVLVCPDCDGTGLVWDGDTDAEYKCQLCNDSTSPIQGGSNMTDTKHTPGPWKTRHSYFDDDEIEIVPVKVRGQSNPEVGQWAEIATVQTDYGKNGCGRANAHLIAAAPDLLAALENLLAVHEGQGGTKYHAGDISRAAIAKAKGDPS